FQAEDGIRDPLVTGVQTCALPISKAKFFMKNNGDLGQEWLKKAESDFATVELCIDNAIGLDAACFHSQQAAEKSLKAWLIAHDKIGRASCRESGWVLVSGIAVENV